MNDIYLPAHSGSKRKISGEKAYDTIAAYCSKNCGALDLYDRTIKQPHNDIRPIDLLSLNALNAFTGAGAMTAMHGLWKEKECVSRNIKEITKTDFTELTTEELTYHTKKVCAALDWFDDKRVILYWGYTRAAKLLYRLRPNIIPIWDTRIDRWYPDRRETWDAFVSAVHADVAAANRPLRQIQRRIEARERIKLPLLRLWDMLLWKTSDF